MNHCPKCNQSLPIVASYCPHCGHYLATAVTGETTRLNAPEDSLPAASASLRCLRCQGPMEEGYVLEHLHANQASITYWISGAPTYRRWAGGLELRDRRAIPTITYRCTTCGSLESFAVAS